MIWSLSHRVALAAAAVAAIVAALFVPAAHAQTTLAQNTSFNNSNVAAVFAGQSATTPSGGPYNNLTFNFYNTSLAPQAPGSLFILTQAYTGTPAALSSGTTGFLAQSTSSAGGVYTFASSVTLQSSTQYFFYANGSQTGLAFAAASNPYAGGVFYSATSGSFAAQATTDWAFNLSGTAVAAAAPEPGSLALFGTMGLPMGLVAVRKLRCRKNAA